MLPHIQPGRRWEPQMSALESQMPPVKYAAVNGIPAETLNALLT